MIDLYLFNIHLFWYLLIAAFFLPRIPKVGKFFNIINTLIHEWGHALFALLLGGKVIKIQIFADTSGTTSTSSKSLFSNIIISLVGYPFAAATALGCLYLLSIGNAHLVILGLSILFLFMLLFWIRNVYGLIWVLLFLAINGYVLFYLKDTHITFAVALFYCLTILIESFYSALVIMILAFRNPAKAGDATNLQKFTHIPAQIWGILFFATSTLLAYLSIKFLLHSLFEITLPF